MQRRHGSLYGYLSQGSFESEYAQCFSLAWEGAVRPDPGEIDEGRFFTMAEVQSLMGSGKLTPMFEREWPMLLRALGRQR